MPANRYYAPHPFVTGGTLVLDGEEARHLVTVMRAQEGESVELVNGCGFMAQATIVAIAKRQTVTLEIGDVREELPSHVLCLYQAIVRPKRLDHVVEKATELGATEIVLFPAQLSERITVSRSVLQRLEKIAIAAMKQCGRYDLPTIRLGEPISSWSGCSCVTYVGMISDDASPAPVGAAHHGDAAIVIGPEAGLTSGELNLLVSLGARGVRLHHNVLRTDTAAIVALGLLTARQPSGI